MPINSFLYPGAKVTPAYVVDNSVRFNDGDSPRLVIANPTAGTRTKGTFSTWFKRCTFGANQYLFSTWNNSVSGYSSGIILLQSDDRLSISNYVASGASGGSTLITERKFQDPSAWYHVVIAWDTTDGTAADRYKIYVNGTRETVFNGTPAYPTSNQDLFFQAGGTSNPYHIGFESVGSDQKYFDGYLAETVLIDGSALAASSFGEFDEDSPTIWKPIDVSGLTFGNEGFYLDYEDSGDLGDDESGNGNDFAETNLAATDQSTDTCTNNFATMNPLHIATSGSPTFSQGNLQIVTPVSGAGVCVSTIGATSGKWYAEVYVAAYASLDRTCVGITGDANGTITANTNIGSLTTSLDVGYFGPDGDKFVGNSETSYGASYAVDDIIGIALNIDDNEVTFYKNNSSQGAISFTAGGTYHFALGDVSNGGGNTLVINFGQDGSFAGETTAQGNADGNGYGDFYYSPPSGYYALNTKNLAEFGG